MPRPSAEFQPVFRRVRFFWDRSVSADNWREGVSARQGDADRWLAVLGVEEWASQLNSRSDPGHFYEPLVQASGLFRDFADVAEDEDSLLAFARKYGPLGIQETYRGECPPEWEDALRLARDPDSGMSLSADSLSVDDPTCTGERLTQWRDAVSMMREAVELWDALRQADAALIGTTAVRWTSVLVGQTFAATPRPRYLGENAPAPLVEALPGAPAGATPAVPSGLASALLDSLIHAHLYVFAAVGFGARGPGRANLYFTAHNLLGAMWLQLALAVDGDKRFETCRGCGHWFEVGAGDKRSRSKHCSDTCKVRAYRKRTEEAGRLHEAGRSVEEIARLMVRDDATPARVRGWLQAYEKAQQRGRRS